MNASDLAIAIGEHAFKAGWQAAELSWNTVGTSTRSVPHNVDAAWNEYTPPEEVCGEEFDNSNPVNADKALADQDHEYMLWQVLDDVQRALGKGFHGRTLAMSALRTHFPAPDKGRIS